jgi:iron complex transport system substrate-binding protein
MIRMKQTLLTISLLLIGLWSVAASPKRIITLDGALTETVDALGLGKNIVAVDVTSSYPTFIAQLPKVSKSRSVSAEGIISFSPDLVLAPEGTINKALSFQLESAGIRVVSIKQAYSVDGTYAFVRAVAAAVGNPAKGEELVKGIKTNINKSLNLVRINKKSPKVLFIYARGAGVMMVAGGNTSMDAIIQLAGGKNAVSGFDDFKPYTTESLVAANPDVILMFDFGFKSLGGAESILKMPGVSITNAGKNKRIVEMDGNLLTGFSVRLPQAIRELNAKW